MPCMISIRIKQNEKQYLIILQKFVDLSLPSLKLLIKFVRYVDDILGVWRGDRTVLNNKIRSMEDEEKGIKLKLEIGKEGNITFLDLKLERGIVNGKIKTKWHQKEGNTGIFCN